MRNTLLFIFFVILYLALCYQTAFAINDTVHFDSNGSIIDKIHYVIIVSEREKFEMSTEN